MSILDATVPVICRPRQAQCERLSAVLATVPPFTFDKPVLSGVEGLERTEQEKSDLNRERSEGSRLP
ncbi:MAG: hypothetical protein HY268_19140 [Deltaproteobacteria bacterium]|nr:hypothetical protein [Deltaproteobacteria bacterium]